MRRLLLSPAAAPAIAACIAALLLLAAVPGVSTKTARVWKGYYTLVLRTDAVSGDAAARALARASPAAVWEESAVVSFSDLEGKASVRYSHLSSRLDPGDPRSDPWLLGMEGWFRVRAGDRSWRVAYLPADRTSSAVFRQLRRELGPPSFGKWRLAEYDPLEKALVLLAALVAAVAMTLAGRAARGAPRGPVGRGLFGGGTPAWLGGASALCWFPFLASGGIPELCVVLAVFPGWLRLAGERRVLRAALRPGRARDTLTFFSVAVCAALAVLFVVAGFSWFRLLGGLLAAASSVLLLGLRTPLAALGRSWNSRRAFPSSRRAPLLPGHLALGRTGIAALGALPFALLLVPQLRGPLVPVPSPLAGARGFSWASIAMLAEAKARRAPQLPDIADYVAHAAWQETLVFGRRYGLPARGERVTVPEYLAGESSRAIVSRLRTVKEFDSPWLAGLVRRPTLPGVEAVLLAQGRPVLAAHGRGRPPLLGDLLAAALCAGALLAWLPRESRGKARVRAGAHLIPDRLWRLTVRTRKKRTP